MEIAFADVATRIWKERAIVILTVCTFIVLVILALLIETPKYEAEMVIGPVDNTLGGSRNELYSLGSVSQVLGGAQRVTPFQIYLRMYKTPELAQALIRDHDILKIIFAGLWDAKNKRWHSPAGLMHPFGGGQGHAPTVNDLSGYLNAIVSIVPGNGEEMQTITVYYEDKRIAQQLLLWMHEEAEGLVKTRVEQRTLSNIAYLNQRLNNTTQTAQRTALLTLLLDQENALMEVQGWNAYAGNIISGPWVSDAPVEPNPKQLLILAVLGGVVVGCGISFGRMLLGIPIYLLRIPIWIDVGRRIGSIRNVFAIR